MAAPAYAGAGAAANAAAGSINVPYPASIAANDILLLHVLTKDNVEINTPSGWSQDGTNGARNQGSTIRSEWFWKRADGTETGNLSVSKASGTTLLFGRMYRFTGCITSGTPFDVSGQNGLGANATVTPTDLDPPDAQDRLMVVLLAVGNDLVTPGNYTGGTATVTEQTEAETNTGTDGTLQIATATHTADTLFDFGTMTLASANAWIAFTLALLPVSGASISLSLALTMNVSVTRTSIQRNLSLALTLTPSVLRSVERKLALALTMAVAVARNIPRSIAIALTLTPTVTRTGVGRNVSLALTLTPTVRRTVSRLLSLPMTLSVSLLRTVQRRLTLALPLSVTTTATKIGGTVFNIAVTVPLTMAVTVQTTFVGIGGAARIVWEHTTGWIRRRNRPRRIDP